MRVLVTGSSGFIGRLLVDELRRGGHEVWGLARRVGVGGQTLLADLANGEDTRRVLSAVPPFYVVVHLAAIAHNEELPAGIDVEAVNVAMTRHLLACLPVDTHFIFSSSVAVYSSCGMSQPVTPDAETVPPTAYGRSKVRSEALVLGKGFRKVDIVRLPPVYDEQHMKDVKKRVFLPVLGVRFRLYPNPRYSLCHSLHVCSAVAGLIGQVGDGARIMHVADPVVYSQQQLCNWFKGVVLPLPSFFLLPVIKVLKVLPVGSFKLAGYSLAKLCLDNVYDTQAVKLSGPGCLGTNL